MDPEALYIPRIKSLLSSLTTTAKNYIGCNIILLTLSVKINDPGWFFIQGKNKLYLTFTQPELPGYIIRRESLFKKALNLCPAVPSLGGVLSLTGSEYHLL